MKVFQVLNNNVVTTLVDGKEVVVIGTGIGFRKKPQDDIDEEKIQSKFYPANNHLTQELLSLLETAPEEIIDIVADIVKKTEAELHITLHSAVYIALLDHIIFSIERYHKQVCIKNALLWDIKKLYKKEFKIGMYAIELLQQKLDIILNEDEAAFIAVHIMNAEYNLGIDMMEEMTKIIHEVVKLIEYYFTISLDKDSLSYLRLINHLKFFAQRILSDTPYENSESVLVNVIKETYKESYLCATRIKEFVRMQYDCGISEEEVVYLSIHIQRLIDIKN